MGKTIKVKLSDPVMRPLSDEQIDSLSRKELVLILRGEQELRFQLEAYVSELEEDNFEYQGQLFRVRSKIYNKKSERSLKTSRRKKSSRSEKAKEAITKLPSERYPHAEIIEKHVTSVEALKCSCCDSEMQDSGMYETSEYLTVVPKKYLVVRQHRHKYRCGKCHGEIFTAPAIPRVIPGSSYSDTLIVDASLSKYCDLIPMERYSQMANRQGFPGLPPHSLIGATFKLAEFLKPAYDLIKQETLQTSILLADETPHKMLEGDEKSNWFLWSFSNEKACFYECHDTRSGDVATAVLEQSHCEVLLTDVYAGYKKAVRKANEKRAQENLPPILMAYCNAHARRAFTPNEQDKEPSPEAQTFIDKYEEIYAINSQAKEKPLDVVKSLRGQMLPIFESMKEDAKKLIESVSNKSALAKACNYFLNNYEGLTLCITNPSIPLDNNASERLLRSHVVGRKTWYGTHSKEGASTAAIHFTIVESCKLNKINPRAYYAQLIQTIHAKQQIKTPYQCAQSIESKNDSS